MAKYAVGVGALNLDIMGRSKKQLVSEDSNPGYIGISVGGATHNACENALRLSVPVYLVSAVGDDYFGSVIKSACQRAGLSTDHFITFPQTCSSCYMSIHDCNGEMNIAVSDMRILQRLTREHLEQKRELLENASVLVLDTGLPEDIIAYLQQEYGKKVPLFADTVSTTYAKKLKGNLSGIYTVKPNIFEAEVLADMQITCLEELREAGRRILASGVERVFISLGRCGVYYCDALGTEAHRAYPPLDSVANATGAGDSFLGALALSHIQGFDLDKTLDTAVMTALLTVQSESTIRSDLTLELVENSLEMQKDKLFSALDDPKFFKFEKI